MEGRRTIPADRPDDRRTRQGDHPETGPAAPGKEFRGVPFGFTPQHSAVAILTASSGRLGKAIGELRVLLRRLDRATPTKRPTIYAECVPLLREVNGLIQPPLPAKEVKALIHEAGWHLRSLAGVAMVGSGTSEDHHSWAQRSLADLASWSAQHPDL